MWLELGSIYSKVCFLVHAKGIGQRESVQCGGFQRVIKRR